MTPKKRPTTGQQAQSWTSPPDQSQQLTANYALFDTKLCYEASLWVDAQGDLKFIQNPIMREVQKFGEHEQASSHLFFETYSNERKFG